MSGYSGRSLKDKLGIKSDWVVAVMNSPKGYEVSGQLTKGPLDFIQFFTTSKKELKKEFPKLMKYLEPNGMLWISWPKGSSGVETDLNENVIREVGLQNGMVDVKVIAVDETWSGLKFVFRLKDRK